MMSNDCRSGTPAFIIVAICRVKRAISWALMRLPMSKIDVVFRRTLPGLMPCLRSCALTSAGFCPLNSPLIFVPLRSVPSQAYTLIFAALTAMFSPW
ncbi:hypothetical protein D3C87_1346470 [compost metagenome]